MSILGRGPTHWGDGSAGISATSYSSIQQHLPGDFQSLAVLGVPQRYLGPEGKWVGSVARGDSCPSQGTLCQAAPVLPQFRPLEPEGCILKQLFFFLLV